MRIENIALEDLDLAGDATSEAFWIGHVAMFAVQLVAAGTTPTGTFKIQGSCDPGNPSAQTRSAQTANVTNWSDISGATKAITDDSTNLINVVDPGYQWVRIVYTWTSGDGTCEIRVSTKGL